jgi:hypothetical protein
MSEEHLHPRRCELCDYFDPFSKAFGNCVRRAPHLVQIHPDVTVAIRKLAGLDAAEIDDVPDGAQVDWPVVGRNNRCGEWAAIR